MTFCPSATTSRTRHEDFSYKLTNVQRKLFIGVDGDNEAQLGGGGERHRADRSRRIPDVHASQKVR